MKNENCAICLEDLQEKSEVHVHAECGNAFHHWCLIAWVEGGREKCPLCRREVTS